MNRLTWKIPTPRRIPASPGDLRRTLRAAFDIYDEAERFFEAIASSARARQHALAAEDEMLAFALDILLPVRRRGTERYLRADEIDRRTFEEFTRFSGSVSLRAIDSAETPKDLADAVISAVDELHAYLLAHQLVGDEYLKAEEVLAERLAAQDDDENDDPPDDYDAVHAAAKNDLALAA